jgi:hypothetical protein
MAGARHKKHSSPRWTVLELFVWYGIARLGAVWLAVFCLVSAGTLWYTV